MKTTLTKNIGRRYLMAVVLGTALAAAPDADASDIPPQAINNISRYCTACWRNARLPEDQWSDCTQEVLCRLLENLPAKSWSQVLGSETEERREFIRAIDAVKKRYQRNRWQSAVSPEFLADSRLDDARNLGDQREALQIAGQRVLSARQQDILRRIADGHNVADIASELAMSPERVSDEKYKAIQKLQTYFKVESSPGMRYSESPGYEAPWSCRGTIPHVECFHHNIKASRPSEACVMTRTLDIQGHIERTRLSDTVYEKLLDAIISGKMAHGTVVSEVALAKQLDVSRTPVHDALRQLAKDGLVEQRAGQRAVICAFNKDDVFDIFEMRKLLESDAARRAAERIDPAILAQLRALAEELQKNRDPADWQTRWADFDDAFHDAIARSSGSPRLWHDIARYRLLHRGFNQLAGTIDRLQGALAEHIEILDALDAHDGDKAARLMGSHIAGWQMYFVDQFSH